ncbi:MAG: cytidylate kinase-like family protein [Pseudomonadota bacterium]
MSVITISRGSYSKGKEIAQKLAAKLGYECIWRNVLLEASEHFNIPEVKLINAIHDAPSVLERFTYGKERYIAFFREALLEHIKKDNIVYHGLGGQFFLKGVPHVLKVRIIANMEDRIREEMEREKISENKARHIIQKDDDERRKWSLHLYGVDVWNPKLYDLTIHINKLSVEDAVDLLAYNVSLPCFQTTPKSQMILNDLILAAKVQLALINEFPKAKASSNDGNVYVAIASSTGHESNTAARVNDLVKEVPGIKSIETNVIPPAVFPD